MNKTNLTFSMILLTVLMSLLAYAIVTVEYVNPIDEFTLIKEGAVMENITFEGNATPSGSTGTIQNMTLWTNISGTWKANFTNDTISTIGLKTNRIFASENTSIFSADLTDGLVFIWNVEACDNISQFYNEDVSLSPNVFTIFDNYTNTTGDGLCNSSCNNAEIILAGRGRVINYPVSTLDGVANTTGEGLPGACTLNGSDNGYFRCNQTRENYNGSDGLLSTQNLITSSVKVNYTISSTCRFVGANRTVFVEDAPNVTLNSPSDSSFSQDSTITFNFTVTGDSDTYTCHLYSNDTGTWAEEGSVIANNNSYKLTTNVITAGNGIVWNVKCSEKANSNILGWGLNNFTITVDTVNPAITLNSPSDNAFVNFNISKGYSATINLTVSNSNADSCTLKVDGGDNVTKSYTSGTHFDLNFNASDGEYQWNVLCNDSAARTTETTNKTITIDTVTPGINRYLNYSNAECKEFTVELNSSEEVNLTFKYGLTTLSQTYSSIEIDYAINQTVSLIFNDSYETNFFSNATICDRAGNCNDTIPEMTIPSPVPLCTGWSLYSIYDSVINLSDYRTASGADFVYYWNNTGQTWIFSSDAGSLNEDFSMGIGDVVQLFESTNTTYFRNNSGNPTYQVDITGGHAYFGLYDSYTFGNISHFVFLNETGGNQTPQGVEFQIDYLSGFNNSNQLYIDAPYQWTWNNDTKLGNIQNGIDTLWAFIRYNR